MSVVTLDKQPGWSRKSDTQVSERRHRWSWRRDNRRVAPAPEQWRLLVGQMSKLLLLFSLMLGLIWLYSQAKNPQVFPIQVVSVNGDWQHVQREQIKALLEPQLEVSFFSLNVDEMHKRLQGVPWISSATIKRKWPAAVEITILERVAYAYWQGQSLLDQDLKVFQPETPPTDLALPQLTGPDNEASQIYVRYQLFNQQLTNLQLAVKKLVVDERRSHELWLDNGVHLKLGAEAVEQRFQDFILIYPYLLAENEAAILSIDMRYPNGMAVQFAQASNLAVLQRAKSRSSE